MSPLRRIGFGLLSVFSLALMGCGRPARTTNEVVAVYAQKVPASPDDPAWRNAPEHVARLVPQDLVEPRLMEATTIEVRARALTDGTDLAFRLQWADTGKDDVPGPGLMIDACAVQIPTKIDPNPPAPQMGEAGRTVGIVFWRADWQAAMDGKRESLTDLYPGASIDHYPFKAPSLEPGSDAQREMATRYAPAQAAGNLRQGKRATPVESLVAEGPGTLTVEPGKPVAGSGVWGQSGWSVVLTRRSPEGLAGRVRTQVAFAVWQGSLNEAGARKMRTGWIPLSVQEAP